MENKYIFYSNGFYLGFIQNGYLFSRDGLCLGWLEGNYVWDISGRYSGMLYEVEGNFYVLRDRFSLPPISRTARVIASPVTPLQPASNIRPISLPVGYSDAF